MFSIFTVGQECVFSEEAIRRTWMLNDVIHAGLKDIETALYWLNDALRKKESQAA